MVILATIPLAEIIALLEIGDKYGFYQVNYYYYNIGVYMSPKRTPQI